MNINKKSVKFEDFFITILNLDKFEDEELHKDINCTIIKLKKLDENIIKFIFDLMYTLKIDIFCFNFMINADFEMKDITKYKNNIYKNIDINEYMNIKSRENYNNSVYYVNKFMIKNRDKVLYFLNESLFLI